MSTTSPQTESAEPPGTPPEGPIELVESPPVVDAEADSKSAIVLDIWQLRDYPLIVSLVLIAIIAFSVFLASLWERWWATPLALFFLALASWRLWLPWRVLMTEDGVRQETCGFHKELSWQRFATWQRRNKGVLLQFAFEDSRLNTLKGLYIPWLDRQEEVEETVTRHLGPPYAEFVALINAAAEAEERAANETQEAEPSAAEVSDEADSTDESMSG